MMRVLLVIVAIALFGCSGKPEVDMAPEVNAAIEKALKEKDFRLYATSGRRPTVPGIEQADVSALEKSCGFRYMEGVGDVIRDPAEQESRQQKRLFMAEFNRHMYEHCAK